MTVVESFGFDREEATAGEGNGDEDDEAAFI